MAISIISPPAYIHASKYPMPAAFQFRESRVKRAGRPVTVTACAIEINAVGGKALAKSISALWAANRYPCDSTKAPHPLAESYRARRKGMMNVRVEDPARYRRITVQPRLASLALSGSLPRRYCPSSLPRHPYILETNKDFSSHLKALALKVYRFQFLISIYPS